MDNFMEKVNKLVLFFIIYSLIFITFFSTLSYTLPFVLAIVIALILKSPTRYIVKKFKASESIASLVTTTVFFALILTLLFLTVTSLASELTQLTKNLSSYATSRSDDIYKLFDKLQKYFDSLDPYIVTKIKDSVASSVSTITKSTANLGMLIVASLLKLISSVPYLLMVVVFTLIATYFFTRDLSKKDNKLVANIFSRETSKLPYIFSETKRMLLGYLKSYMIIIFITFIITLLGFVIAGVQYGLVLSVLCALFDLLPILGISIIYAPIAIVFYANGMVTKALFIVILYAIVMIVRQIVEPRIVSSSLGLHPVAVLGAIFIGLKVNGFEGMVFCMFLVVFYNILKKVEVL